MIGTHFPSSFKLGSALANKIIVLSREKHLNVSAQPQPSLFLVMVNVETCFRRYLLQLESLSDHNEAQGQPTLHKQGITLCCATLWDEELSVIPAWPGLSWLVNCPTSYQVFYTCLHLPTTCTGPHSRRNCFVLLLSHGNSILASHWYLPSCQVSFLTLFFEWLNTPPTSSSPLKWHSTWLCICSLCLKNWQIRIMAPSFTMWLTQVLSSLSASVSLFGNRNHVAYSGRCLWALSEMMLPISNLLLFFWH